LYGFHLISPWFVSYGWMDALAPQLNELRDGMRLFIAPRYLVNPNRDEQYNSDHNALPEHWHAGDDQRILNQRHKQDP
jgi:hypothetical protein